MITFTSFNSLPINCITSILVHAKNPTHARVCQIWHTAMHQAYLWIAKEYKQDAFISKFMPNIELTPDMAFQIVKSTFFEMNHQQPVKNFSKKIKKDPLDLGLPKKIIEAVNLVRFFEKFSKLIPDDELPLLTRSPLLDAIMIRSWMRQSGRFLEEITSLNLSFSNLTVLPPEIALLKNLTHLSIPKNQLRFLPKEIGQLCHLKLLDAGENQLTFIPPEIGQLNNMHWLFLGRNQLTVLPKEIGQLRRMTLLNISENPLVEIPRTIEEIYHLEWIGISESQLNLLPPELIWLRNSEVCVVKK